MVANSNLTIPDRLLRRLGPKDSPVTLLAKLTGREAIERFLAGLDDLEALLVLYQWDLYARPTQRQPAGEWDTWVILGGRGMGKTRPGSETVIAWARELGERYGAGHIGLIAKDPGDARKVMIEGQGGGSAILECSPPWFRPRYEPSKKTLTWDNGVIATVYSSEDPDELRGPQHHKIWGDELCLVAGTMIQTDRGAQPIETLRPGARVWTRAGWRRVLQAQRTGHQPTYELRTAGGRVLRGTARHPVYASGRFIPLASVVNGDTLATCSEIALRGTANAGTLSKGILRTGADNSSTGRSISITTDRFRGQSTFTTGTRTHEITGSAISRLSPDRAMSASIGLEASRPGARTDAAPIRSSTSGESARRAGSPVRNVAAPSNRSGCARGSVTTIARRHSTDVVVAVRPTGETADVYNLEVEETPEYFANGILVHNCKWRHPEATWDNAAFGCRLGDNPQKLITTTPRPMKLLIELLKEPTTRVTRGSMYDNAANLPAKFIKEIKRKYEGTRLGRQEIHAELLMDTPGALWNLKQIDRLRVKQLPCPLVSLVVAIDPAGSSPEDGVADDTIAETGIIAVGKGEDGHGYVVLDASGQFTPAEWGAKAVSHYGTLRADYIIGETNNGGDMVEHVVKVAAKDAGEDCYFKKVTASRGKRTRAEPVAALYEQGRFHHIGAFPELEDQMCTWVPGAKSPDRMDALVWGATETMLLGPDDLIFR